jgi:hypothetical protein
MNGRFTTKAARLSRLLGDRDTEKTVKPIAAMPRVAPGSPEATRSDYFFIFKSLPRKVLTIATMSPSWVS